MHGINIKIRAELTYLPSICSNILFPNGSYIDCLSLFYATNKAKMLKITL
jgi:hypothetical protein